jgi:hypothetical protein
MSILRSQSVQRLRSQNIVGWERTLGSEEVWEALGLSLR